MNLANTIKEARKKQDLTREQLADYLHVTVSAISQWETGKTAPDLSLIPPLCHLLRISADTLLGIDASRVEEEIAAIARKADRHLSAGDTEEAMAIALAGLDRYPDSDVLTELVLNCYEFDQFRGSEEEKQQKRQRIFEYANKLLTLAKTPDRKYVALQRLAHLHQDQGRHEQAVELAMQFPCRVFSREAMLCSVGTPSQRMEAKRNRILYMIGDLTSELLYHNDIMEDGEPFYSEAEMARLLELCKSINLLIFEGEDLASVGGRLSELGIHLARYYLNEGKRDQALEHLSQCADHAIAFVKWCRREEPMIYTSLPLRGLSSHGICAGGTANQAQYLTDYLKCHCFLPLSDDARYDEILKRLAPYCSEWEEGSAWHRK